MPATAVCPMRTLRLYLMCSHDVQCKLLQVADTSHSLSMADTQGTAVSYVSGRR